MAPELYAATTETVEPNALPEMWTTPRIVELSVEDVVELADIDMAFAQKGGSSDLSAED